MGACVNTTVIQMTVAGATATLARTDRPGGGAPRRWRRPRECSSRFPPSRRPFVRGGELCLEVGDEGALLGELVDGQGEAPSVASWAVGKCRARIGLSVYRFTADRAAGQRFEHVCEVCGLRRCRVGTVMRDSSPSSQRRDAPDDERTDCRPRRRAPDESLLLTPSLDRVRQGQPPGATRIQGEPPETETPGFWPWVHHFAW
jgi:hypothetical protein